MTLPQVIALFEGRCSFFFSAATISMVSVIGLTATAVAHDDSGTLQFTRENNQPWNGPAMTSAVAGPPNPFRTIRDDHRRREASDARHHRTRGAGRSSVGSLAKTDAPSRQTAVSSFYVDRTLRRGDAVMTSQGLRIFNGSDRFPYLKSDFSTLSASSDVKKRQRLALSGFDRQTVLVNDDRTIPALEIRVPHSRS